MKIVSVRGVAIIAPNGASQPVSTATTEVMTGLGKCGLCDSWPIQVVDRAEGRGYYRCNCKGGRPRIPMLPPGVSGV